MYPAAPGSQGFPGDSSHRTVAEEHSCLCLLFTLITPPSAGRKVPKAPPPRSLFSHTGLFVWAVTPSDFPSSASSRKFFTPVSESRSPFILHADSALSRSWPAKPRKQAAQHPLLPASFSPTQRPGMVFKPRLRLGATPQDMPGRISYQSFLPSRNPLCNKDSFGPPF